MCTVTSMIVSSTHSSLLSATQWGAKYWDPCKETDRAEWLQLHYTTRCKCAPSYGICLSISKCVSSAQTSWLRLILTGGSKYEVLTEHFATRLVMIITLFSATSGSIACCLAGLWGEQTEQLRMWLPNCLVLKCKGHKQASDCKDGYHGDGIDSYKLYHTMYGLTHAMGSLCHVV